MDWAIPVVTDALPAGISQNALNPLYPSMFRGANLNIEELQAKLEACSLSVETAESIMTLADQLISESREEGGLIGQLPLLELPPGQTSTSAGALTQSPKADLEVLLRKLESESNKHLT